MLKLLFELLCNVYFIPSAISLILLIKYSSSTKDYVEEYSNFLTSDQLDYGHIGRVSGILGLVFLLGLMIVYESCAYQMRHTSNYDFYSKNINDMSIGIKVHYLFQCYLLTDLQITNYHIYLLASTVLYLVITLVAIYQVPYNSSFSNTVHIWLHFNNFFAVLCFLIQFELDSASVGIVLILVMQPVIVFLAIEILAFRVSKFKSINLAIVRTFNDFEQSIRKYLQNGEKNIELLSVMNEYSKNNNNQLIHVLQANYCYDILNNSELALLKIESACYSD